jgi:hypothetical protein
MPKHKEATATTRHRDRTLKRNVLLSWSGYRPRTAADGPVLLAAHNDTGQTLHIDSATGTVVIAPGSWAVVAQDNRFRSCTDMVFRLKYEPTEDSQ